MADRRGKPPGDSLYERYKDALRRGHVAVIRGRLDAAIDAYGEAAAIAPDRALPHAAIGAALVRMGRGADALAAYDRALNLAPTDEAALRGRADVLTTSGRRVAAATTLDRLAEVLDAAGRLPEACDAARRALEMAESKDRRRFLESLASRLRVSAGDEASIRALADVMSILETAEPPAAEPAEAEPGSAVAEDWPEAEPKPEPEPEPPPEPEPEPPDGLALGAAAEESLYAGDTVAARDGLLAAAEAHRQQGRSVAAIDACYLALAVAPADVELHLMLAELYIERGWRGPAVDKLLLLGRLAAIGEDAIIRERICRVAGDQLPNEPRLAELCAT